MRKLLLSLILLVALPLGAARDFDGTTGDFLRNETSPSADMPLTICGWFNADNISVESTIAGFTDSASSGDYAVLEFLANGAIRALVVNPGVGSAAASTTANVSAGDHHGCAVFATSTDRRVYLDGGNKGTSTGSVATTGINRVFIGLQDVVGGAGQRFGLDGRIWEVAVWTAILTDAEVAILALRYSPRLVRPASLERYWPVLGRTSPEIDLMSGNNMTVTGTAVAAHSAMIYPTQPISGFAAAAAPPAGKRRAIVIAEMLKYAPAPILAGGLGLAWVINRRNKLLRDGRN